VVPSRSVNVRSSSAGVSRRMGLRAGPSTSHSAGGSSTGDRAVSSPDGPGGPDDFDVGPHPNSRAIDPHALQRRTLSSGRRCIVFKGPPARGTSPTIAHTDANPKDSASMGVLGTVCVDRTGRRRAPAPDRDHAPQSAWIPIAGIERVQREPRTHSARRTSSRGRRLSGCAQKRAFWHPFVALVGPTLRVQFPPREPNECNERWWRRWELNPRPQRLRIMRYVRLPGTPRRVSLCLSSAVIQVMNTTMRSPDLPLIAAEP